MKTYENPCFKDPWYTTDIKPNLRGFGSLQPPHNMAHGQPSDFCHCPQLPAELKGQRNWTNRAKQAAGEIWLLFWNEIAQVSQLQYGGICLFDFVTSFDMKGFYSQTCKSHQTNTWYCSWQGHVKEASLTIIRNSAAQTQRPGFPFQCHHRFGLRRPAGFQMREGFVEERACCGNLWQHPHRSSPVPEFHGINIENTFYHQIFIETIGSHEQRGNECKTSKLENRKHLRR